jgi:putative hydrolase of the HAD superfamily
MLFDFGRTLVVEPVYDYSAGNAALLAAASETNGVTHEMVEERAERLAAEILPAADRCDYQFPAEAFTRLLFEPLGVVFDRPALELELVFWEASCPRMSSAAGIHVLLDLLDERGIPAGVVSNCSFSGPIIAWELGHSALADRFRFIMSSKDYGLRKPDPELFRVAAAKLGVPPDRIWFCGDRLDRDVAGARAAGMTAVWYNARGEPRAEPAPHLEIAHWDELTTRLASLLP